MSVPYPLISDTQPWVQAIAGLNQFIYSTTWTADTESDILVYSRTSIVDANDGTQLVSSNDYSVQFIGDENIVQVSFNLGSNPPQGNIVTIMRNTPSDRMNLYTNTNFTASMLNSDFGTLTLIDQDLALSTDKFSPHYYNSSTTQAMDPVTGLGYDEILPVLGANQFWAKDDDNLKFIAVTLNNGELPIPGPFITYEADAGLSQAFNLGLLSNGILAQTVLAATSTPYIIPLPVSTSIGGSGLTSTTPYALLLGGATPTSPFGQITNLGTAGFVLTSNGAGANPSFQNPIYIEGILGTENQINVNHTLDPNNATLSLSDTISTPGTFTISGTTVTNAIINDSTMATATAENLSTSSAIKTYIHTVVGGGFTFIDLCAAATTANFASNYANGAAGVGATLTALVNGAAGNVDDIAIVLNTRVLFKNQTSAFENGVYTLTTVGDGATPAVYTRATDYDTAAEILPGTLVPIQAGTLNGGSIWLQTLTVVTVGTDPIAFIEFAQPSNTYVTLATNQTITGTKTFQSGAIRFAGSTSGYTSIQPQAISSSTVLSLPNATDTLVALATTDTLTNKSISGSANTLSNISYTSLATATAGSILAFNAGGAAALIAPGTVGQVLTSNGAGATPTMQDSDSGGVPVGTIIDFGSETVPTGYLSCNGAAVSRVTYAALWAIISTTWGSGDGSTTFNLPNLNRRTTIGSGDTGTATISNVVGSLGGTEFINQTIAQLAAHDHPSSTSPMSTQATSTSGTATTIRTGGTTAITVASQGTGADMNIIQPSAVVLKCIKY